METHYAVTVVALTLSVILYWLFVRGSDPSIPTVSLLEYLPNGLFHPVVKDPQNYHHAMIQLGQRYGRIFHMWLGATYALVTAIPEDIVHVMTSESFRHADNMLCVFQNASPGGITSMPRPIHRSVRRTLRDSFSTAMLESFESRMNAAVAELCDVLRDVAGDGKTTRKGDVVDISATLSMTTFRVITNVAFGSGLGRRERQEFGNDCRLFFEEIMKELLGYPYRQYLGCFGVRNGFFKYKKRVTDRCRVFVQRRLAESKEEREARDQDILDIFLDLDTNDENAVTSFAIEFAVAGSHTTNQVLAWSIYETCCYPRVVKAIHDELEQVLGNKPKDEPLSLQELRQLPYVHKVWRETLRMHPIGTAFLRTALSEVTLKGSGTRIPKGRTVLAFFSLLHMDPQIWTDPDEFMPERWGYGDVLGEGDRVPPGACIPFGVGIRSCAGKFLADYEGPLILAELHRRFAFSLACEPEEVVSRTALVQTARYASNKDGNLDMGVPLRVQVRV